MTPLQFVSSRFFDELMTSGDDAWQQIFRWGLIAIAQSYGILGVVEIACFIGHGVGLRVWEQPGSLGFSLSGERNAEVLQNLHETGATG